MIETNKHKMYVYAEGEKSNKPTLIIMPMSAITVPVYDYKILYSKLSDEYRIVVVEKAGYGYSEVSGGSRNVETMVSETRNVLEVAGEKGPYVLLPAFYSGIEALYWAQTYPDEIAAIIGLNIAIPEAYSAMNLILAITTFKILNKLAFIGLLRISFELSRYYDLSKEKTKQYIYLANARMFNKDMGQEGKDAFDNAKKVNEKQMPQVPLLLFTTDESTGIDGWRKMQYSFAEKFKNSIVIELDCEHEVHCYESDYIAENTKEFLKQIYRINISTVECRKDISK